MGIQFFGEFLIDRWVITRGQLIEALELQEYRNLRFGAIAVQKKYLTEQQVEQINEKQKSTDMCFADLAISMGLLTQEQSHEILIFQKNNHLYLGEALLELGHITEDILDRELDIFREEQARYDLEEVQVPEGVKGKEIITACVDLTRKMFLRVVGIMVKVGEGTFLEGDRTDKKEEYHISVVVLFQGATKVRYIMSVSSDVAVSIASRILNEDATRESEAVVEDAVKEFCNIVCGNASARLAQMGLEVEIAPPEAVHKLPQPETGQATVQYYIHLTEGGLDLRFLVPKT